MGVKSEEGEEDEQNCGISMATMHVCGHVASLYNHPFWQYNSDHCWVDRLSERPRHKHPRLAVLSHLATRRDPHGY